MKIIRNIIKCKNCKDVIESKTIFELDIYCKCKKIFIGGGLIALKRGGDFRLIIERSIIEEDGKEVKYTDSIARFIEKMPKKVKAYILRCVKCEKKFESKKRCNAKCTHCEYVHSCYEVNIIDVVREKE